MPSARSATAMRPPTSPLPPRFDGPPSRPSSRGQTYQPRSPSGPTSRRNYGNNLTLTGLPRYHPINYSPINSSFATTPTSGPGSPHAPTPPGLPPKMSSESQRAFHAYQRGELRRTPSAGLLDKPGSPRLEPLGSPGPVTPLELESADGYLGLAKPPSRSVAGDGHDELNEKLAQAARLMDKQTSLASDSLGAR